MKNANEPRIEFSSKFNKERNAASLDIKIAFREAYEIFQEDPDNEVLRNHPLDKEGKKFFGFWSIDVTGNWRAIYRKEENKIIFVALDTHGRLYK